MTISDASLERLSSPFDLAQGTGIRFDLPVYNNHPLCGPLGSRILHSPVCYKKADSCLKTRQILIAILSQGPVAQGASSRTVSIHAFFDSPLASQGTLERDGYEDDLGLKFAGMILPPVAGYLSLPPIVFGRYEA